MIIPRIMMLVSGGFVFLGILTGPTGYLLKQPFFEITEGVFLIIAGKI